LQWHRLNLARPADLSAASEFSKKASVSANRNGRAFDLDWRCEPDGDVSSLRALVLREGSSMLGFALFSIHRLPLKLCAGEITFANVDLIRHWHPAEPYLESYLTSEATVDACGRLLDLTVAELGHGECLFFEGMPADGPMRKALAATRRVPAVRLELGDEFEHQFIRMPSTLAEYVTQLGSRSRQSVLYSQRRLRKDMGGDVRCECFESVESVDRFVSDAVAVSRKTYQWNLLGLGLRDADGLRGTLTHAARHGWLRSFILYCKESPAAFMLGSQHGDCYYYDDVGYDPAFAKWSVGSVLQIEVLEHLFARADKPSLFDFSVGYGEHKARFGNLSRRECNTLVLPPTTRNRLVASVHRGADATSRLAARVLQRTGLKNRMKQLIRHRSKRTGDEESL
jgi:GNAT acetyltransferase-like protein